MGLDDAAIKDALYPTYLCRRTRLPAVIVLLQFRSSARVIPTLDPRQQEHKQQRSVGR